MGDRSNVILKQETGPALWLYSHNGGEWFQTTNLANALEFTRDRWGDESYFNRSMITQMFSYLTGTTGGGVSLTADDNDGYPFIQVDGAAEIVQSFRTNKDGSFLSGPGARWTFEEFIAQFADKEN